MHCHAELGPLEVSVALVLGRQVTVLKTRSLEIK